MMVFIRLLWFVVLYQLDLFWKYKTSYCCSMYFLIDRNSILRQGWILCDFCRYIFMTFKSLQYTVWWWSIYLEWIIYGIISKTFYILEEVMYHWLHAKANRDKWKDEIHSNWLAYSSSWPLWVASRDFIPYSLPHWQIPWGISPIFSNYFRK